LAEGRLGENDLDGGIGLWRDETVLLLLAGLWRGGQAPSKIPPEW